MLYSLVQFFSMGLLVKSMDKAQVANWNILLPTGILLAAIVTFGMDAAVVRFVKDASSEKEKKTIFSTGFYFVTGFAVILALSVAFFPEQMRSLIQLSPVYSDSLAILAAWLPGVIMAQYFQNWFKYSFRRVLFLSLIFIQSLVYLSGVLVMKFTNNVSLYNIMLSMLASQAVVALIGMFFCRKLFSNRINKNLLGQLIFYGLPFMFLAFGYNLIAVIDRYILPGKISEADFAVYTQAFRISAIVSMVVSSFSYAFNPFLLALLGQEKVPETLGRFHTYYLMTMCFIGLCFLALSKIVIHLMAGMDYLEGQKYMLLFVMGYVFYGMYSFAQAGIIHSKKSYFTLYALLAGLLIVFIVDIVTVKRFSGYGTAAGFMFANITMVIFASAFSRKYVPIKYSVGKDFILLGLLFGGGMLLASLNISDNIVTDGIIKLVSVVILGGLILISLLSSGDRTFLRNMFSGRRISEIPHEKSGNLYK